MILFADGRQFQIAGTVLSDGTTIIPFSEITLGTKPGSFPLPTDGVGTPMLYVELIFIEGSPIVAAMSVMEYNKIALAQVQRTSIAPPAPSSLAQRIAGGIARRCGACGRR